MRSTCTTPSHLRSGQLRPSDAWRSQVRPDRDGLAPAALFLVVITTDHNPEGQVKSLEVISSGSVVAAHTAA